MTTMFSTLALAVSLIAGAIASPRYSPRQRTDDGAQIVARTRSLYKNTTAGKVEFSQRDAGGTTSGTLWFSTGDRYRLEYPNQTIVSDGASVWRYVPSRNQVVISTASKRAGQITPDQILTMFPGDYETTLVGSDKVNGKSVWVVRATAGSGTRIGDVTEATLYINKSTYRFEQIGITSAAAGAMTITVNSANYNGSIPASRFSFSPPKDTRVVDLRR